MFLFTLPPQGMINMKNIMGFVKEKKNLTKIQPIWAFLIVKMKLLYRINQW